jgi:hypothetical protein
MLKILRVVVQSLRHPQRASTLQLYRGTSTHQLCASPEVNRHDRLKCLQRSCGRPAAYFGKREAFFDTPRKALVVLHTQPLGCNFLLAGNHAFLNEHHGAADRIIRLQPLLGLVLAALFFGCATVSAACTPTEMLVINRPIPQINRDLNRGVSSNIGNL